MKYWIGVLLACLMSVVGASERSELTRHLRFTMSARNTTAAALHDQKVTVYGPVSRTATQSLEGIETSVPHKLVTDDIGNSLIEFDFDSVPPFATKVITISAVVRMREVPVISEMGDRSSFLRSEPLIPSDSEEIASLAQSLDSGNVNDTVRAIYHWVRGNLTYSGYTMDDMGASYALQHRRGDCTEYAYLVTALARARSIPARVIGGYVVDQDTNPRPGEYHNWAEVYVDGAWQTVDAQKESLFNGARRYVAFRIVGGSSSTSPAAAHRFSVMGSLEVSFN